MNETIEKFGYPDTLIHEYDHWVVLMRPQQVTLGALVLAAKSTATRLSDLDAASFTELREVVGAIEPTLADWVHYARINYLMLMMVDPNVHYHVIPRYEGERAFAGIAFPDAGWPGPPALGTFTKTEPPQLAALVDHLRRQWPARGST